MASAPEGNPETAKDDFDPDYFHVLPPTSSIQGSVKECGSVSSRGHRADNAPEKEHKSESVSNGLQHPIRGDAERKYRIRGVVDKVMTRAILEKEAELYAIDGELHQALSNMDSFKAGVAAQYYGQAKKKGRKKQEDKADRLTGRGTAGAGGGLRGAGSRSSTSQQAVKRESGQPHKSVPSSLTANTLIDKDDGAELGRLKLLGAKFPTVRAYDQSTFVPLIDSQLYKTQTTLKGLTRPYPTSSITDASNATPPSPVVNGVLKIVVGNVSKYTPGQGAAKSDPSTHKWMVYVRGPRGAPNISPYIEKVMFFLHNSYRPHDLVVVSESPFHLSRRGWGDFPVRVRLHIKSREDGSGTETDCKSRTIDVIHELKLDKAQTGLQTLGGETHLDIPLSEDEMGVVKALATLAPKLMARPAQVNARAVETLANRTEATRFRSSSASSQPPSKRFKPAPVAHLQSKDTKKGDQELPPSRGTLHSSTVPNSTTLGSNSTTLGPTSTTLGPNSTTLVSNSTTLGSTSTTLVPGHVKTEPPDNDLTGEVVTLVDGMRAIRPKSTSESQPPKGNYNFIMHHNGCARPYSVKRDVQGNSVVTSIPVVDTPQGGGKAVPTISAHTFTSLQALPPELKRSNLIGIPQISQSTAIVNEALRLVVASNAKKVVQSSRPLGLATSAQVGQVPRPVGSASSTQEGQTSHPVGLTSFVQMGPASQLLKTTSSRQGKQISLPISMASLVKMGLPSLPANAAISLQMGQASRATSTSASVKAGRLVWPVSAATPALVTQKIQSIVVPGGQQAVISKGVKGQSLGPASSHPSLTGIHPKVLSRSTPASPTVAAPRSSLPLIGGIKEAASVRPGSARSLLRPQARVDLPQSNTSLAPSFASARPPSDGVSEGLKKEAPIVQLHNPALSTTASTGLTGRLHKGPVSIITSALPKKPGQGGSNINGGKSVTGLLPGQPQKTQTFVRWMDKNGDCVLRPATLKQADLFRAALGKPANKAAVLTQPSNIRAALGKTSSGLTVGISSSVPPGLPPTATGNPCLRPESQLASINIKDKSSLRVVPTTAKQYSYGSLSKNISLTTYTSVPIKQEPYLPPRYLVRPCGPREFHEVKSIKELAAYSNIDSLVAAMLSYYRIVSPSDISLFVSSGRTAPSYAFQAHNVDEFLRWPVGKRRAVEWKRAKLVSHSLSAISLQKKKEMVETLQLTEWSTKHVLLFARRYAFTPPYHDTKVKVRSPGEGTTSNWPCLSPFSHVFTEAWFRKAEESSLSSADSDGSDVDVVGGSPPPLASMCRADELRVSVPSSLFPRLESFQELLHFPTSSAASASLHALYYLFMERLIRQSFAVRARNESENTDSEILSPALNDDAILEEASQPNEDVSEGVSTTATPSGSGADPVSNEALMQPGRRGADNSHSFVIDASDVKRALGLPDNFDIVTNSGMGFRS